MTNNKNLHPADSLAIALDRSTSLVNSIGDLYDAGMERFSGGEAFVAHALSVVSTLIIDAKASLEELHYQCDLALIDEPVEPTHDTGTMQARATVSRSEHEVPDVYSNEPAVPSQATKVSSPRSDDFARSYVELLQKLTDAEVFAAEQQALAAPGTTQDFMPLLKSLREEIQKLHSAA